MSTSVPGACRAALEAPFDGGARAAAPMSLWMTRQPSQRANTEPLAHACGLTALVLTSPHKLHVNCTCSHAEHVVVNCGRRTQRETTLAQPRQRKQLARRRALRTQRSRAARPRTLRVRRGCLLSRAASSCERPRQTYDTLSPVLPAQQHTCDTHLSVRIAHGATAAHGVSRAQPAGATERALCTNHHTARGA